MYSQVEKLDDRVLLTASIWFDQPEYLFEVPIGTPVGALLGSVSISSDGPIDSPWYFGGGGVFDVDYGGGIFTNSVVTGSPGDEIVFNVDAYTIGAYASTTVRVTLLPSSTPQLRFTQAFYEFSVPVGTGAGSVIENVAVTGGEFPWFWGIAAEFYVDGSGDIRTNDEIAGSPGDVITFSVHAEDMSAWDVAVVSITLTSGTSSVNQRPEFVSHDGVDAASDSNDFYSFFFDVEDQFLYADRSVQKIHSWPYGQIAAGRAGGDRVEFHTDGSYSIEIGGNVTHFTTGNPFQLWPTGWYWPNQNIFEGSLADRVDLPAGAIVRFTVMVGIPGIWDWSDPDPNEIDVASVEITASDLAIDVSVDGLSENDETSPGLIVRVNQDDDNHDGREDRFVADADPS